MADESSDFFQSQLDTLSQTPEVPEEIYQGLPFEDEQPYVFGGEADEDEWGKHKESWLKAKERHLEDMKTLVQEYADHKQGVSGWNLDNITTAIGDDNALRLDFIDYIKKHTNRTHTNMLLDAMGVPIDDTSGADSSDDTTTTTSQTAVDVGSVATEGAGQTESATTDVKQQHMATTATTAIEKMKPAEQEELYKTLSQRKYSGTSTIMLEPYQEEILRQLTAIYGTQNVDAWWRQY